MARGIRLKIISLQEEIKPVCQFLKRALIGIFVAPFFLDCDTKQNASVFAHELVNVRDKSSPLVGSQNIEWSGNPTNRGMKFRGVEFYGIFDTWKVTTLNGIQILRVEMRLALEDSQPGKDKMPRFLVRSRFVEVEDVQLNMRSSRWGTSPGGPPRCRPVGLHQSTSIVSS